MWTHKLGEAKPQGISRAAQTTLVRLMESQIWPLPAVSVAQKRNNGLCPPFCLGEICPPALALMPDTSLPPHMPLVPFKLLPQCLSSEGVNVSKSMCKPFKRHCLGLREFLSPTRALLVCTARSNGSLSSLHWSPGLGGLIGAGTLSSRDNPPKFLAMTRGCGTSLFCVSMSLHLLPV